MANRIKASEPAPRKAPERKVNEFAEFEKYLLIDKDALDEELINHPDLVYRISMKLVNLVSYRDAAKQDKDEAEAKADARIRRDAARDDEKVTADQVKAEIKLDPKVIEAADRYAELKLEHDKWGALDRAFTARRFALAGLVDLYGNNYWSDASGGRASARRKNDDGDAARAALKRARREGGSEDDE